MRLEHSFVVPTDIDTAWATLTDVSRVAPCMPGATLQSVDGDEFSGDVRVKLGPIGLSYALKGCFTEQDSETHRAVIHGGGKEKRGSGTATATVTLGLDSTGTHETRADVVIDLDITGRPAQFGRSALSEVSSAIVAEFATRLSALLAEVPHPGSHTREASSSTGVTPAPPPAGGEDAVNLARLALVPMARSAGPALVALAAIALLVRWFHSTGAERHFVGSSATQRPCPAPRKE